MKKKNLLFAIEPVRYSKIISLGIALTAMFFLIPLLGGVGVGYAQNIGINTTGAASNASALLDVDAAPGNNKGLLIPRVTNAQRIAMNPLPAVAQGLTVYQTDAGVL